MKRIFDYMSAILGLLILAPFLIIVAILIWIDSNGPVFYRGVRSGQNGHLFRIFKFRTMVTNAENVGGLSTGKDDPRITRVGKYLRRYKLDELPQLINVLKGEMSIVGPRPEMPEYTSQYEGEEKIILTVKPGITDYASLEFIQLGDVLGTDEPDRVYEEKIKPIKNALRVKYVKEQSLWGDLVIIFKTIRKLVFGV